VVDADRADGVDDRAGGEQILDGEPEAPVRPDGSGLQAYRRSANL